MERRAGGFPPHAKFDLGRIQSKDKRVEVVNFIKNVRSQMKSRSWKVSSSAVLLVTALLVAHELFLPLFPESLDDRQSASVVETNMNEESPIPTEFQKTVLITSASSSPIEISIDRLGLDRISGILPETKQYMGSAYGVWNGGDSFEYPRGIFYFAVADSYLCGAQNCNWVFFRYDQTRDQIRHLPGSIRGTYLAFVPSPQNTFVLLQSETTSGSCLGSYSLALLNLISGTISDIDMYDDFNLETITSLHWRNDREIDLDISLTNCGDSGRPRRDTRRFYRYDVITKKRTLLSAN